VQRLFSTFAHGWRSGLLLQRFLRPCAIRVGVVELSGATTFTLDIPQLIVRWQAYSSRWPLDPNRGSIDRRARIVGRCHR